MDFDPKTPPKHGFGGDIGGKFHKMWADWFHPTKSDRTSKFQCWNCERIYSLARDVEGEPRLVVECPYCEHEAVVDLAPFRDETVVIFESTRPENSTVESLNLPDVLPTSPKNEESDSDV